MSDESVDQSAPEQAQSSPKSNESQGKQSLEDAFAGDTKSKLGSNFVRPKKLGLSSFKDGADELVGTSKKGKKPLSKPVAEPEEPLTSFDPPPKDEKPAQALPKDPKPKDEETSKDLDQLEGEIKEPDAPKLHKVLIDGEEKEITEEELKRDYQIRKASDERFRQAAEIDKRNKALIEKAKDPEGVLELLKAFGHDPRALSEQYLAQMLEFEMMTPEQQEIAKLRAEKAHREREINTRMEQERRQKAERESEARAKVLQTNIIETMNKNPDLPRDSGTVRRVIEQMRVRIKAQAHLPDHLREDVTPASVLDDVRASIERDLQTKASQMTPEQLAKFLGKEKLDEYRKWELSQVKNPIRESAPKQNQDMRNEPKQKRHYKTMEEFRENQRLNGVKTFGGRF